MSELNLESRRKAGMRALTRRYGMLPDQAEAMREHHARQDDWRVHCHSCGATIVGSQSLIRQHGEECRGA